MYDRVMNGLACLSVLAAFLCVPFAAFGQSADRAGVEGVRGVVRGAAASAGPCRAVGCISQTTVVDAAFIAAGTGAVIAAAPEVMGISAGVAALGLMGFAGAGLVKDANSSPKGANQVPEKPLEAGIADQSSKSER